MEFVQFIIILKEELLLQLKFGDVREYMLKFENNMI